MQKQVDGMLKQFSSLAEKHKQKAAEISGPPKEDITWKASTPDKAEIFRGVDMDKTKDQLMQVMKSLRDASTVASDLTLQFAGPGAGGIPQEEQMDYWFRLQQRQHYTQAMIAENKIQVSRRCPAKMGEKNPTFQLLHQAERTLVGTVVVGSKETSRFVKKLVYAKYDPKTLEIASEMVQQAPSGVPQDSLLFPVALFRSGSYLYTVCNLLRKESMSIALVRSKVWEEDKEGDAQFRVLEGLFEKGLQAVDFHEDLAEKKGYLLVRGVAADRSPGHGFAILDLTSGLIQQWLSFAPVLPRYAELQGFVNGLDDIGGLVRDFLADSKRISVSYDRKTQSIAVHGGAETVGDDAKFCKKKAVCGSDGKVLLASANMAGYQGTGKSPPQALLRDGRPALTLPDSFHVQSSRMEEGGSVLLLGTFADGTSADYLLARVPLL